MSLLRMLEDLEVGQGADPEPSSSEPVTPVDKINKAYELKAKGVPVRNIASSFKVAEATVYRWLNQYEENFKSKFHDRPREELLLDSLRFVSVVRDVAMAEAHQIDLDVMKVGPTGKLERDGKPDRMAKHRMLKLAMEAEKTNFGMLRDTGVLPNAVREIHYSVNDTRPEEMKDKESNVPKTREQMVQIILDMVEKSPSLPGPTQEELEAPLLLADKNDVDS